MIGRIGTLVWKEFLELRQSPRLLGLIIVAPVIQLTLLGYAATTDIANVPVIVVDGDHTPRSRQLLERFAVSPHFDVVADVAHPDEAGRYLADGRAWLAIVVPPGFQRAIETGQPASARQVQILADGTDANSSGVALAYATGLIGDVSRSFAPADRGGAAAPAIEARVRVWFNPALESRDFMVPGVIALLLLVITSNLSSMAIVRERELGTLEQLNVTPLGRWELILGKLLPYAMVGFLDVLLVMAVAVYWFEVPFEGSVAVLLAGSLAYLLCTLGLGLFVSTISSTQQQAMMTSTFFFLVPMIYLSGFIFPIENMPRLIQWVTTVIPLRYFLVVVRGVFLKGVGWDVLWPQMAALTAWGTSVLVLAALRSRKQA
jgi:ABC-2 type transport system permease protein